MDLQSIAALETKQLIGLLFFGVALPLLAIFVAFPKLRQAFRTGRIKELDGTYDRRTDFSSFAISVAFWVTVLLAGAGCAGLLGVYLFSPEMSSRKSFAQAAWELTRVVGIGIGLPLVSLFVFLPRLIYAVTTGKMLGREGLYDFKDRPVVFVLTITALIAFVVLFPLVGVGLLIFYASDPLGV